MPVDNEYLLHSARTMVATAQRPSDLIFEKLKEAAIHLYKSTRGTFASDKAAIDFIIYDKPQKVRNLIFAEAESVGTIRHYIENLTPGAIYEPPNKSQCGKGAEYNPVDLRFKAGKTFCWLCGCPIGGVRPSPNAPECEHIIPMLRATMTVGMFTQT